MTPFIEYLASLGFECLGYGGQAPTQYFFQSTELSLYFRARGERVEMDVYGEPFIGPYLDLPDSLVSQSVVKGWQFPKAGFLDTAELENSMAALFRDAKDFLGE